MQLCHLLLPLPFSKTSHMPLLAVLQIHVIYSHCCCLQYTHQDRQTDTLLSLYVTCVYVFKANHLALVNQLVLSSLGKTITPKSRFFFEKIKLKILHEVNCWDHLEP